jgi:hypothetical protein
VGQVEVFDGQNATPSLAQLSYYDIVISFSNASDSSPTALGDALADYQDRGGVVVALVFGFYNSIKIADRWDTGGYSPFTLTSSSIFREATLGTIFTPGHPLLEGISSLQAYHPL